MTLCFAADSALGTLAKWLRILGYDTVYDSHSPSKAILEDPEGGRILLTRTKKIQKKFSAHRTVFITSNYLRDQLKQVIDETGIDESDIRPFSRCITCNLSITQDKKEEVYGRVPDYIWQTNKSFSQCKKCRRIYWSGTHAVRSMERINQLFRGY